VRLLRYADENGPELGLAQGDLVFSLGSGDLAGLVDRAGQLSALGEIVQTCLRERGHASRSLDDLELLPPVERPTKVIGVGMNYESFISQIGEDRPSYPVLFHKTSSALTGAGQPVVIPPITEQAVPEGELAVIIGRCGSDIDEDTAADYVLGYTCANDISARNLEFRTSQWTSGKMLPTFCPLGPWLVTSDEIVDPQRIAVRTLVNDRVVQDGNTADMVFGVRQLVSEISRLVRLETGDVILTGTPSDLGELATPVYLRPGDVVTVEIGGIGRLRNPVRQS
jgi:2-keto-4-pentenoate hydratase/2-oxohepta-3-ene-1,7-dioic acid hydratase in catechol pathway